MKEKRPKGSWRPYSGNLREQFKWELIVYETMNREWSLLFLCCWSKSLPTYLKSGGFTNGMCTSFLGRKQSLCQWVQSSSLLKDLPWEIQPAHNRRPRHASQANSSLSPFFPKFDSIVIPYAQSVCYCMEKKEKIAIWKWRTVICNSRPIFGLQIGNYLLDSLAFT